LDVEALSSPPPSPAAEGDDEKAREARDAARRMVCAVATRRNDGVKESMGKEGRRKEGKKERRNAEKHLIYQKINAYESSFSLSLSFSRILLVEFFCCKERKRKKERKKRERKGKKRERR
jgi:hypothetical protein